MSETRARSVWLTVILIVFILWFGSYSYEYVFTVTGLKPLYSYFALLSFSLFYLLYREASGSPLVDAPTVGVGALFLWLGLYLAYGAFEFLRSTQDPTAIQALITLCEAVLLTGAFAVLITDDSHLRTVTWVFAILAILGSAINIWDFLRPTFSAVPGRAAGLYVNPNIAGSFVALAMVAGLSSVSRHFRLFFLGICAVGVLVTFSRGSWIIWAVAVVTLGWWHYFSGGRRRVLSATLAVALCASFAASLFLGAVGPYVAQSPVTHYLTPDTSARLGIGASVLSGNAAKQREMLVIDLLSEAAATPWLGRGLGYTTEWRYSKGPHDMYLLFLVEGGLLGLLLYLTLIFLLWRYSTGIGRVLTLQFIGSSFFTHNQLVQPAILMIVAFVFAHGAIMRGRQRVAIDQIELSLA